MIINNIITRTIGFSSNFNCSVVFDVTFTSLSSGICYLFQSIIYLVANSLLLMCRRPSHCRFLI